MEVSHGPDGSPGGWLARPRGRCCHGRDLAQRVAAHDRRSMADPISRRLGGACHGEQRDQGRTSTPSKATTRMPGPRPASRYARCSSSPDADRRDGLALCQGSTWSATTARPAPARGAGLRAAPGRRLPARGARIRRLQGRLDAESRLEEAQAVRQDVHGDPAPNRTRCRTSSRSTCGSGSRTRRACSRLESARVVRPGSIHRHATPGWSSAKGTYACSMPKRVSTSTSRSA